MNGPHTLDDRAQKLSWRWLVRSWILGSLAYATHLSFFHAAQGVDTSFPIELAEASVHLAVWVALVPAVLVLAERLPTFGRGWAGRTTLHVALGAAVALVQVAAHTLLDHVLLHGSSGGAAGLARVFRVFLARTYYGNVALYLLIVVGAGAVEQSRRQRARAANLELDVARAQLEALRFQLQPHFLLNALHTIGCLVADDPRSAQSVIARLGDFLRTVLAPDSTRAIPLWKEVEHIESYLEVEAARFGDRLQTEIAIDPEVTEVPVPGLLLQPLIENAIRHGVARHRGPARLTVCAARCGGSLRIEVVNSPSFADHRDSRGLGVGLVNVRARLQTLYGPDGSLTLRREDGDAMAAIVELPIAASAPAELPRRRAV